MPVLIQPCLDPIGTGARPEHSVYPRSALAARYHGNLRASQRDGELKQVRRDGVEEGHQEGQLMVGGPS